MSTGDGMITVTIDGKAVSVPPTTEAYDPALRRGVPVPTTIYDAAAQAGVTIPTLCHREYMNPVAVCRVCVVEVGSKDKEGRENFEWRLAPACHRRVADGMIIKTRATSTRVEQSVKTLTELLMTDHPSPCAKHQLDGSCELERLAETVGVTGSRFAPPARERPHDESSVVIKVDHNACILCDRCVRGCNEIRHNEVIGRRGKGYTAGIAFDLDDPMGASSCVACGECMVSCPTGALTIAGFVTHGAPPRGVDVVGPEELADHPLFQGVSMAFLRLNEGAVRRLHVRDGQVICREGDPGSTAYYIEQGQVTVRIQAPIKHAKGRKDRKAGDRVDGGFLGLFRRFRIDLVDRQGDTREGEDTRTHFIHIDAPVSLDYSNPVATLEAGDIFGEMTCMSSYPRSATVVADGDGTLLELDRNVLYILQRNKASKRMLDDRYLSRAVDNHLRSVPILADLAADEAEFQRFLDFLLPRDGSERKVDLVRYNPGEVIFHQGDPADDFYLVRIGFVKVAQRRPGGERVLNYLGRGKYFGEIGLMAHVPGVRELAPEGVRTATCSALDDVDLLRIRGPVFRELLEKFPKVREEFARRAADMLRQNAESVHEVETVPLADFLNQGLMNAQSLLVLDLEKCTRCDECTKACADSHDGVTRLIREGLRFDKFLVASSCRSCLDPYCMVGCPVGSIRRRPPTDKTKGLEIIIEDWCIGCGKCAENCPYGNINMHSFDLKENGKSVYRDDPETGRKLPVVQQKATTCDLCSSLDSQPSCVYACPHDAAHRMRGEELLQIVQGPTLRV
ncbi:MAG TPA: cyclic nucleotide-binding domain-containing protein [Isosphaeraceae bacterium]|jgi:CRP-like cAMP-binding protein|nr:cyclic nucleotide-binding domain-containing protein [Isosphaeraceae bacterium]